MNSRSTFLLIAVLIIGFFGGIAFVNNWLVLNKNYPEVGMFDIPFKASVWGTVSDWVMVCGTTIMIIIAWKALHSWKKEKEHEMLLEAYAFRKEAKDYLNIIRDPIGVGDKQSHREIYEMRKASKNDVVDKFRSMREKLSFYVKDVKHPLRQYYNLIYETDDRFNSVVGMLDFYSREIAEKKELNYDYKKEYDAYNKIFNEIYSVKWTLSDSGIPHDEINQKLYILDQELQ